LLPDKIALNSLPVLVGGQERDNLAALFGWESPAAAASYMFSHQRCSQRVAIQE